MLNKSALRTHAPTKKKSHFDYMTTKVSIHEKLLIVLKPVSKTTNL